LSEIVVTERVYYPLSLDAILPLPNAIGILRALAGAVTCQAEIRLHAATVYAAIGNSDAAEMELKEALRP